MNLWHKIVKAVWKKRKVSAYPADPSPSQIQNAQMMLKFYRNPAWQDYEEYLAVSLGEAMEGAFVALKKGDNTALVMWVARAEAQYRLLTEPQNAESIAMKVNKKIVTLTSASRD